MAAIPKITAPPNECCNIPFRAETIFLDKRKYELNQDMFYFQTLQKINAQM